jgi:hypothetical protein
VASRLARHPSPDAPSAASAKRRTSPGVAGEPRRLREQPDGERGVAARERGLGFGRAFVREPDRFEPGRRAFPARAGFAQQGFVRFDELGPRRDSELTRQRSACTLERPQSFGAAARALVAGKQEGPPAFAQRLGGNQCLEVGEHVGRPVLLEGCRPPRFDRGPPELLELGPTCVRGRPVMELVERCVAAPRERRVPPGGPPAALLRRRTRVPFEAVDVGLDASTEAIAVADGLDRGTAEFRPDAQHVRLDRLPG